jgi:hypothetical protein
MSQKDNMAEYRIFKKVDLPLEVVILSIAGMALLMTGVLLFPVSAGKLPYYENGLYGLLLVIFALQIITLGKTPFGDMQRSKFLLAGGSVIAAVGIATCFVPDIFSQTPRLMLFICFGAGGALLLLQMLFARDKFRSWIKYGGIFRHLILGCGSVYLLSMLFGLLIWKKRLLTMPATAVVVLVFGTVVVYLAFVLRKIYRAYPEAEQPREGGVELSTEQSMLLLMGMFMILLGVLLIPVNLGMLPFSGSAQLGLLMVMFAVQMLATGNTPIGPFPRSWLMILLGLLFAAPGIVSCIIPEVLVPFLTILVGVLNILGGAITLGKLFLPNLKKSEEPRVPRPAIMTKLFATQLIMNLLSMMFGTSMLIAHLIPGLVVGVILACNGVVLLYLLHILKVLEKMQRNMEAVA